MSSQLLSNLRSSKACASVLPFQHIPDGLNVWVIGSQRRFLDDERSLKEWPAFLLMPLHQHIVARTFLHTSYYTDLQPIIRYMRLKADDQMSASGKAPSRAGEALICMAGMRLKRQAGRWQTHCSSQQLACSRCRTARSVSVCATSGWSGPCTAS